MPKVIVTGGAGYIGCHATKQLLDAGFSVVVLDKLFFPSGVNYVKSLPVELIEADIRDFDLRSLAPFDDEVSILHLAGLSNDPSANFHPVANDLMNRVATESLCHQAAKLGCSKFIFASSASVYGFNDSPRLDETAPLNPISHYAASKAKAEEVVNKYASDIGGIVLRQGTVMGWSPRHRGDLVVNTMTKRALDTGQIVINAGGEATRPLLEVRDLAETYVRLLQAPAEDVCGQTFNVSHRRADGTTFEGYTIGCLALWIKEVLEREHGVKAEVVGNWSGKEGRSYDMTSRKLRRVLDWEPSRGVSAAVDSIMAHRNELGDYDQNNIAWLKALEHGQQVTKNTGSVFVP